MTVRKTKRPIRGEVYRRKDKRFDFRFVSPNGLIVSHTTQGFSSRGNAHRGLTSFLDGVATGVEIVDIV